MARGLEGLLVDDNGSLIYIKIYFYMVGSIARKLTSAVFLELLLFIFNFFMFTSYSDHSLFLHLLRQ